MTNYPDMLKAHLNACGTGELTVLVEPGDVKSLVLMGERDATVYVDLEHTPDVAGMRVLMGIDQLRRDLSVYHGQLKAHNDLEIHAERQRDRIHELEGLHRRDRDENAKLRELVRAAWKCIHTGLSCSDCRIIAGGCTLHSAMRELGIEVEE